jgi:hypothetical protein
MAGFLYDGDETLGSKATEHLLATSECKEESVVVSDSCSLYDMTLMLAKQCSE